MERDTDTTQVLEENETYGPKVGVKISLKQADLIIQRHFPLKQAVRMSHVNRGYNNRVYIVTTSCKENGNEEEFVLRLSGRFWNRYKTENEVCALLHLARHCPSIPIPAVYGFCTDREKSGVNAEYILMEKIRGEPLENIWEELNLEDKKRIVDQLVPMYGLIQKVHFEKIGSFQFASDDIGNSFGVGIDPQRDILEGESEILRVGKGVEFDGGPFSTFIEYFKSSCETELDFLRKCNFMREGEDYEKRLGRIERFVEAFKSMETVPEGLDKTALLDVPFVFTQGDFEPRNFMVDPATLEITGLLDFEFSGAYPIEEEWYTGFRFADADTAAWIVFNEERDDGQDCLSREQQEMSESLRAYFLSEMRKNGVIVNDIDGHMTRSELFYFKGYISPWWLREKVDPVPESHYGDRRDACRRVDFVLDKYGF